MAKSKRKARRSVASNEETVANTNGVIVTDNRELINKATMNQTSAKQTESLLNGQLSSSIQSLSETEISESSNKVKSPLCNTVITVGSVSPKTFDGTHNVDEYVEHFTQIAKCNNWSPKLQMSRIPIYLTGPANLW